MWRILFGLAWIGLFILSVLAIIASVFMQIKGFNAFGFVSIENKELVKYFSSSIGRVGTILIISGSLFYIVLFIKKIQLLFKKQETSFISESENGRIAITLSSIDNIIKGVIKESRFIIENKVKSYIKNEELSVNVKLTVKSIDEINKEVQILQQVVKDSIHRIAGITAASVDIVVSKVLYEEEDKLDLEKRGEF